MYDPPSRRQVHIQHTLLWAAMRITRTQRYGLAEEIPVALFGGTARRMTFPIIYLLPRSLDEWQESDKGFSCAIIM